MDSTWMSRVLNEPGQKSTRIEICKKNLTQPGPNPWWARLAHGFQPILTALIRRAFCIVGRLAEFTWRVIRWH